MENKSFINIGLPGLIFCIFLTLKLLNKIDWSWVWITSPLWSPIALIICFVVILLIAYCILFMVDFVRGYF